MRPTRGEGAPDAHVTHARDFLAGDSAPPASNTRSPTYISSRSRLLIRDFDPAFGSGLRVEWLGWGSLVARNLVAVTVGNLIGGTVLVAAVYWFVYLRRPAPG